MLIRNGVGLSGNPMSVSGSTTGFYGIARSLWTRPGAMRGFDAGPATVVAGESISDTAGRPNGYEAPHAWLLARRGGGLAAYTSIEHPNVFTSGLSLGINLDATMTADGTLTTADLVAIANLAATLTSNTALAATMQAFANMASTMTANDDLSSSLSTFANLTSSMVADGSITTAELSLVVSLTCAMVSDGSLSTANLTLLVSLACTMISNCDLSPGIQALAQLTATLLATDDLAGALGTLSFMTTTMVSDGTLTATMRGTLSMDANMSTQGTVDAPPTPGEIAIAVWEYALAGTSAGLRLGEVSAWRMALLNQLDTTSPTSAATQMILARKILNNRLEVEIASQSLVLYDDDGYTVLKRWPLTTTGGEAVATGTGVQTKRGVPT